MKKISLILLMFALLTGCASTGSSPTVGDQAPYFSLADISGNEVNLSDFKGKKSVILIFYADNNWRPCIQQLGGLQNKTNEIEELNAEIIAISTTGNKQDVELTKKYLGLTYTLISAPNRKVGEDFNLAYDLGAAYATIIIDKNGLIRYKSIDSWSSRTSASKIIRELQAI